MKRYGGFKIDMVEVWLIQDRFDGGMVDLLPNEAPSW